MSIATTPNTPPTDPYAKLKGAEKLKRIPIKIEKTTDPLPKPPWIRIRLPSHDKAQKLKARLHERKLVTVCEEAACPNLAECYAHGTATFMIMGDKCTRRCSFCDVGHGRPDPLDQDEPRRLAEEIAHMGLRYVVITSVDRDDLRDGGAGHFTECITRIRALCPEIKIEVLVPDFRGRMEKALEIMQPGLPDVFNHNIETVPRLYKQARPGSDYQWSLTLLQEFKTRFAGIPTKSGIMVGLGETDPEIEQVMHDLRQHNVDMLTIGQYLQPSPYHLAVDRYVHPEVFQHWAKLGKKMGFTHVASGPMVRSSYHADLQAAGETIC